MPSEDVAEPRVELLNGAPAVRRTTELRSPSRPQALLLAVLGVEAGRWVPVEELKRMLYLSSDQALQQRVARLKRETGLTVDNDRSRRGYRLALSPHLVDAAELLRAADSLDEEGEPAEEVARVVQLWRDGPGADLRRELPELFERLTEAHRLLSRSRRKRVLIIDDKVGDHLKRLLAECECTVVRNLEEFEGVEPKLRDFDLALVDVHLTSSYVDHQGLEIVNRIVSSPSDILVLGMTLRPLFASSTRRWQRKHDLVDLVTKHGDDETTDFSNVVGEVRATLAAGPRGQLVQLLEDFVQVVEEARTKLLAEGKTSELDLLRNQAARIIDMQFGDVQLSRVRVAIGEFRRRWNVTFVLGSSR